MNFKYTISPYSEDYRPAIQKNGDFRSYLDKRFGNWCFTDRGRSAIDIALSFYNLNRDDIVTIVTTSGNRYISGCVTGTIEKHCKWSRELDEKTRVILVNHEFGYPYKNLSGLKSLGIPIIEDCAYNFFSIDPDGEMGNVGDFVIYSLSKAFPLSHGGILKCNLSDADLSVYEQKQDQALTDVLSEQLRDVDGIISSRLYNYKHFFSRMEYLGVEPFFKLEEGIVPGVILFKWYDSIDYPRLKVFMQENGVESSVFYGENAFYVPIHQNLKEEGINIFCNLLESFNNTQHDTIKH